MKAATETIEITVAGGTRMRIAAYPSKSTPGLAAHRQVVWVPAAKAHKFSSKWNVTHVASGTALLLPSQCTDTLGQAQRIMSSLDSFDWSSVVPPKGVYDELMKLVHDSEESNSQPEEEPVPKRFVTRRNSDGPGYVVVDTATDTAVETFMHRGMASNFASEKNAKEAV
jgi:hypothetical protein